jgi:acetolactate synthase-1/2/3 large subunit
VTTPPLEEAMQATQTHVTVSHTEQPLNVSQLLLRYLDIENTTNLFGVPGVALSYLLYELKLQPDKFTYHICRHETGASYMADGYSRVTGKLGVVLVSSGPGATNALTGAAVAQACGSSQLVVSGEVAQSAFGRGGFQEGIDSTLNVDALYRNADHYSVVISDPTNFQTLFTKALRIAMSRPGNATHISLPQDVGGETVKLDVSIPLSPQNYRAVPKCTDVEAAKRVIAILADAQKPMLFLGNGCRDALLPTTGMSPELRAATTERMTRFQQLIEKFAVPVITSPNGKGIFPESHPLSLRNYGFGGGNWGTAYISADAPDHGGAEPRYDALVILGSSLGQKTTNDWDPGLMPHGPIVQVDLDQGIIGRGFPIELGVVAEIGAFIDDLIRCGESVNPNGPVVLKRLAILQAIKMMPPAPPATAPEAKLASCISELLPPGAQVFIDATSCGLASIRYLTIDPPTQVHNAFVMEPMGWAPAAVIGAAIGAPDSVCISISGDGGFMMNGNEVSTAARYDVGAIWVVFSNNVLGVVEDLLAKEFGGQGWKGLYQLGSPDLAAVARGLGADAFEARSIEAFREAFSTALGSAKLFKRPQVIVVNL